VSNLTMTIRTDKPLHLIINPRSGYGSERLVLAELRSELRLAGYDLVEYTTKARGDATRRARQVADDAAAVIVWGGDGTVSEIANGLLGSDVPILPCLAGTENLLAKELLEPADPQGILEVLRTGLHVHCDVGSINGRNFLLIIGIGFDGEVVRRLSAIRTGHISHLSYFWPIWRTFWEHDFPRMRIVADGQEIFNDFGMAFVGNISRYAVGLRICRDARFDDGLLDLVIFSCREQTALILHAAWTLLRRHPLKGGVIYRQVKNVTFETDRTVPSQVDGDPGPGTPLNISATGQQIVLLVPRRRQAWSFWPFTGE
jgi:YegS/Rv2252/BmrU family lipid kinase